MTGRKRKKLAIALRSSQRGDTIVSILLSMAVITLVIVLAYTLVSQSLRRGNEAREREQVKNLIQSQIEGLKNLAATGDGTNEKNIFYLGRFTPNPPRDGDSSKPFCLKPDGLIDDTLPLTDCDIFSNLDAADVNLTIIYTPKDTDGIEQHLFVIKATWDSANNQESTLAVPVRIHPLNQSP